MCVSCSRGISYCWACGASHSTNPEKIAAQISLTGVSPRITNVVQKRLEQESFLGRGSIPSASDGQAFKGQATLQGPKPSNDQLNSLTQEVIQGLTGPKFPDLSNKQPHATPPASSSDSVGLSQGPSERYVDQGAHVRYVDDFGALFEAGKQLVSNPDFFHKCPRANTPGKTSVYLPGELPIVLKKSGTPEALERLKSMNAARRICEKNGYIQLVIPRARCYGDYIIEDRLPIIGDTGKASIGLYLENQGRFTLAIKEFTGFLCQSFLSDIVSSESRNPYVLLTKVPVGRYDNVALYLNEGKIGLIDLERFEPKCPTYKGSCCFSQCLDAVRLFPCHLEEIMSVAKQFDPNIEIRRKALEIVRDNTITAFQIIYTNHANFIREKGISGRSPLAFEKLGETRIRHLQQVVEAKLREAHDDGDCKGCLGEDPDQTLIVFKDTSFPQILAATYKLLEDALEHKLKSQQIRESTLSIPQLAWIRTLEFSTRHIVWHKFLLNTAEYFKIFNCEDSLGVSDLQSLLCDIILKEMESSGAISYFHPNFGLNYSRRIDL